MIYSSVSESAIARRREQWLRILRAGARRGAPPSAWRPAADGGPADREQPRGDFAGSPAELEAIIEAARPQLILLFRSYRVAHADADALLLEACRSLIWRWAEGTPVEDPTRWLLVTLKWKCLRSLSTGRRTRREVRDLAVAAALAAPAPTPGARARAEAARACCPSSRRASDSSSSCGSAWVSRWRRSPTWGASSRPHSGGP